MKGSLTSAAVLLLALAGAGTAGAQETMMDPPRASRFDLGIYAGGSVTSRWFESRTVTLNGTATSTDNDDAEAYKPGYAPIFGVLATFWATPAFGVRAHGAYAPMREPSLSDGFFDVTDNAGDAQFYTLNTYVYDLDLVVRPFIGTGGWYRTVYLWAGGGGLTVNQAGENAPGCNPNLLALGACLSYELEHATVGQGTAGAGIDLIHFTRGLGLFGEIGAHVYDSPVHTGDGFVGRISAPTGSTVRVADDRTAVTTRAVIGLKAMFGDLLPPPPPPVVELPPPPPPVPMDPPPAPVVDDVRDITVCVVQNGALANVAARYNTTRGDTMVNGQPFASAFPTMGQYAADASWFINSEPITVMGRRYVKYGLPRVLGVSEVARVGDFQGVPVFAEPGMMNRPDVVYVAVRPGCEFQPYNVETKASGVRGE
ncbi:MAG TPA: hypothetical protein VF625_10945 [Longimicrobium sp.]